MYKFYFMNHQALSSITMYAEKLWHSRYGHVNHKDIILLQKENMVEALPILKNEHVECDGCALVNQHKNDFPISK